MKSIHKAVAATFLITVVSNASALEPLSPPGSFDEICRRIPGIKEIAETIAAANPEAENSEELFNELRDSLINLAFAADTRLTFDANDIEEPLGAAEFYFFYIGNLSREERAQSLRYSVSALSATYGCEEWKWPSEFE